MFDSKFFDALSKKLTDILPDSLHEVKQDLEKNFRSVLQSTFSKLDLVTREEFDVQTKVLNKTRLKLEELSEQIAQLEAKKKKT
jgi:ubiquinone biosynthesis accessory factor UbiK